MARCLQLIEEDVLPACQYFAYIEVVPHGMQMSEDSVVWQGYSQLGEKQSNFAMRQVSQPGEIYPVFRELFSGSEAAA